MKAGLLIITAVALLQPAAPRTTAPAELPGWLSGAWVTTGGSAEWTEEWWTPPRAGIMMGASRSGKAETLGFFEHMRIARGPVGIEFCALPKGQAGGCFPAVSASAMEIVFENRAHDYPQRIVYRRDGERLITTISLLDGSKENRWELRRAK